MKRLTLGALLLPVLVASPALGVGTNWTDKGMMDLLLVGDSLTSGSGGEFFLLNNAGLCTNPPGLCAAGWSAGLVDYAFKGFGRTNLAAGGSSAAGSVNPANSGPGYYVGNAFEDYESTVSCSLIAGAATGGTATIPGPYASTDYKVSCWAWDGFQTSAPAIETTSAVVYINDDTTTESLLTMIDSCRPTCSVYVEPGTDVALLFPGDLTSASITDLTIWTDGASTIRMPVLATTDCGGTTCQDEPYVPILKTNGVNVTIYGPLDMNGQSNLQPAPNPIDCATNGSPTWGSCTYQANQGPFQILVHITGGAFNADNLGLFNSTHAGIQFWSVVDGELTNVRGGNIGCNDNRGYLACGPGWDDVPSQYGTGREVDGYGIYVLGGSDRLHITGTFGKATKASIAVLSAPGCAEAESPEDILIENFGTSSTILLNGNCRGTLQNVIVQGVRAPGEEGVNVGHGIAGNGNATFLNVTIDDVQGSGLQYNAYSNAGFTATNVAISDPCMTQTTGGCGGVVMNGAFGTNLSPSFVNVDVDITNSRTNTALDYAYYIDDADELTIEDGDVTGGASELHSAMYLKDVASGNCGSMTLATDTTVGDVMELNGVGATTPFVIEADCFAAGYTYNGNGDDGRIKETNSSSYLKPPKVRSTRSAPMPR